jgi:DHA1 family bicyclomycin/chloramphenicol resistance-like MFS transporter
MARTMSFILTIFLDVPVVALLFGAFILSISSWQVVFLTPFIAVFVIIWSFRLNESLRSENHRALNVPTLVQSARHVLTNRRFVCYTAVTTILFSAFIPNVSSSASADQGLLHFIRFRQGEMIWEKSF